MKHKSQLVNISPIYKCRPYNAGLEREGAVCVYCWWSCHFKYSLLYIKSEFLSRSKSVDVYDFNQWNCLFKFTFITVFKMSFKIFLNQHAQHQACVWPYLQPALQCLLTCSPQLSETVFQKRSTS